jgi:hypothetical protein
VVVVLAAVTLVTQWRVEMELRTLVVVVELVAGLGTLPVVLADLES